MCHTLLHFIELTQEVHRKNLFSKVAIIQLSVEHDLVQLLQLFNREFLRQQLEADRCIAQFASDAVDVMAVADAMAQRRWYLGRQLTSPPSLHVVLTPIHAPVVDDFLRDLREVADAIGRSGRTGEQRSNYAT
jgi:hypothetical protein